MKVDSVSLSLPVKSLKSQSLQHTPLAKLEQQTEGHERKKINTQELIDKFNSALRDNKTHIKVQMHEQTNTIMVRVIADNTNEVIREIPSEKMLDFMYEMCIRAGIFIDEKW
ncbi:flagellar protein FlaG [Paenibacillus sp. 481]|uniref:flagellar protein FlaG n=1 Tax=Paenibacillus sp. 481 TaxID=2835869 RepID=UPI001E41024A|nr:flagellar protein FlaG [Paenibacillus sp. 481]UHA75713.1 flagellar protein FlaG [Paenibacillus sp. 481]